MKLFQLSKPVQPRRRRKKKFHKWIDKAKTEVKKMPSLGNLEEDILVKAAILCTAGQYSLKLTDFRWKTPEEAAFVQNMIWVIEALQRQYPRYLQYAKWVAIKRAVDLIEGPRKGYRKNEDADHRFVAQEEAVPPPDIDKVMEEELPDSSGSSTKCSRGRLVIGTSLRINQLRPSLWILMARVPSLR
jgi:hypothetical protein